jgi:hypothetical protein
MIRRRLVAALAIAASVGTSACITDPDVLDGIIMGLDQVNAQLEWENRNCYYAPPPGNPYGSQRYCPGDYGYVPPVTVYPGSWQNDDDRRDRRDRRERRRDRDQDRDD